MLKTIVVLPDGQELSSGSTGKAAISGFTLTQCVNAERELTVGSVCAAMAELTVIDPAGTISLGRGQELTVYRQDEQGQRQKVGIFLTETPTRPSRSILKITAYDRVSLLDRDLTAWLAELTGWPYSLQALSRMVCSQCGLQLTPGQLPNGGHMVEKFAASGVTGRHILRWIGQLTGRFFRATPDGQIEAAWYVPKEAVLGEGEYFCFQNGLSLADYAVSPVEKVHIRQSQQDVGTVYPQQEGEVNTYCITGNPLAAANTANALVGVAQTLFEQLQDVTYTPGRLVVSAGAGICAGDIVTVQGNPFYVMTRKQSGNRDILECTGSPSRNSSTAVNDVSYQAISGKVLNLSATVDGLQAENRDASGRIAGLSLDVEGIASQVLRQQADIQGAYQQLTQLRQDEAAVELRVKKVEQQGVQKVTTETGFTFDETGLTISKAGTQMENLLNETGMFVKRSGQVILQADQQGVEAADVSVRNFLIVGDHARLEDYSGNRTACFWI